MGKVKKVVILKGAQGWYRQRVGEIFTVIRDKQAETDIFKEKVYVVLASGEMSSSWILAKECVVCK